jgi:hypothetical protein
MKRWWKTYIRCLRFNRWPVLSPEELRLAEQKKKLDRLFGRS